MAAEQVGYQVGVISTQLRGNILPEPSLRHLVTNAVDHFQELWDLGQRATSVRRYTFRTENGEEALLRHFTTVERRDATGTIVMDDAAIRRFAGSWDALAPLVRMPPLAEPLRVRRHSTVFTAHKAVG